MIYRQITRSSITKPPKPGSALTQLKKIEQSWHNKIYTSRHYAYQLATVLRQTFNLNELTLSKPVELCDDITTQQWQKIVTCLNQSRYMPSSEIMINQQLFEDIRELLMANHRSNHDAVI